MSHDDATLEKAAAITGSDVRRLKRLCGRCEERIEPGELAFRGEGAPYFGMRLHARCIAALAAEEVPPEPGA